MNKVLPMRTNAGLGKVAQVSTILIPCLKADRENVLLLLRAWGDSRFKPSLLEGERSFRIIIWLNNASLEELREIREACMEELRTTAFCKELIVEAAGLEGDADLYIKNAERAMGEWGNKAGPNNLFFSAMERCRDYDGYVFQCEVDCYPLAAGWIDVLDRACAGFSEAWVIGSCYYGIYPVADEIQHHVNGNALYKAGDPGFQKFLKGVWKARLEKFIGLDPNMAYDCWWSLEFFRASAQVRNVSWSIAMTYMSRIVEIPLVLNLLHSDTFEKDVSSSLEISGPSGWNFSVIHSAYIRDFMKKFLEGEKVNFLKFLLEEVPMASLRDGTSREETHGHGMQRESPPSEAVKIVPSKVKVEGNYIDQGFDVQNLVSSRVVARVFFRLQVYDGKSYIEFRPDDNPEVYFSDAFHMVRDEWGLALRYQISNINEGFVSKLRLNIDPKNINKSILFEEIVLGLYDNWNAIIFSADPAIKGSFPERL